MMAWGDVHLPVVSQVFLSCLRPVAEKNYSPFAEFTQKCGDGLFRLLDGKFLYFGKFNDK
jgi:hypothetical protein